MTLNFTTKFVPHFSMAQLNTMYRHINHISVVQFQFQHYNFSHLRLIQSCYKFKVWSQSKTSPIGLVQLDLKLMRQFSLIVL